MSNQILVRSREREPSVQVMDAQRAIELLPEPYAKALSLKRRGLEESAIAEQLDIAVESVQPCLKLAEAKLANLLAQEDLVES